MSDTPWKRDERGLLYTEDAFMEARGGMSALGLWNLKITPDMVGKTFGKVADGLFQDNLFVPSDPSRQQTTAAKKVRPKPSQPSLGDQPILSGVVSEGTSSLKSHALKPDGSAACSHMLYVQEEGLAHVVEKGDRCGKAACKKLFAIADAAAKESSQK